jgi:hypothetical protein
MKIPRSHVGVYVTTTAFLGNQGSPEDVVNDKRLAPRGDAARNSGGTLYCLHLSHLELGFLAGARCSISQASTALGQLFQCSPLPPIAGRKCQSNVQLVQERALFWGISDVHAGPHRPRPRNHQVHSHQRLSDFLQ